MALGTYNSMRKQGVVCRDVDGFVTQQYVLKELNKVFPVYFLDLIPFRRRIFRTVKTGRSGLIFFN